MEPAQKAFHVPYFFKKKKRVYVFTGLCNINNKVMIQTGYLLLAFFFLIKQVEEMYPLLML